MAMPASASLPDEINAATRHLHTTLNRLITSRLPLALPPHALDSSLYATGLTHFAHIFLTFESLWDALITTTTTTTTTPSSPPPAPAPYLSYLLVNPYDAPSLFTSTLGAPTPLSPPLAAFLRTLRPRGLKRTTRLKADLEYLLGLSPADLDLRLALEPSPRVAEFCAHLRKSVNRRPWTLVSYAWCFYMAVFSGGRWIRRGLLAAPPEYWPASDEELPVYRGMQFWHFLGAQDGEDIKARFRTCLAAAETLFTPDERVDIIEEAKNIFRLCATLVDELDALAGTQPPVMRTEPVQQPQPVQELVPPLQSALLAPVLEKSISGQYSQTSHALPASPASRRTSTTQTVTIAFIILACLAYYLCLHRVCDSSILSTFRRGQIEIQ